MLAHRSTVSPTGHTARRSPAEFDATRPDVVVYGDPGSFPATARPEMLTEWEMTREQFMHLVFRDVAPSV